MAPTSPMIARVVVVNIASDRAYDYHIPERLRGQVQVGCMVEVPFQNGYQRGFVVALPFKAEVAELKELVGLVGQGVMIPGNLLRLAEWLAEYYCCSREQSVRALLPAAVRRARFQPRLVRHLSLVADLDPAKARAQLKRAKRQLEAFELLLEQGRTPFSALTAGGIPANALAGLVKAGLVLVEELPEAKDPFADHQVLPSEPLALNDEQAAALAAIRASMVATKRQVLLLNGVTGSGKTEVYLQAIATCLEQGLEAIVLVPEIALTPQTTERFRARFGERVSVLHSHLTDNERLDMWQRVNEGRVSIVVGARSAIFAPFTKLGLIVVDEEHESSYKQSDVPPRYHARDVAVVRGHFENVTVLLGTATPSLESYYNVERGKYGQVRLTKRVDDQVMPSMEVVDMAAEAQAAGKPHVFSRRLVTAVRDAISRGEQVMLFLNRRGYATQLQCLQCGYVAECDQCSAKYTYHRGQEQIICHLCGAFRPAPTACPQCSDPQIRYSGLGTERIESICREIFTSANVLRMDSDTMTSKGAYREALSGFRAGTYDLLVGTQMIAKGLHFPNVTLVGIIMADSTLNLPDFRAGERTFQLLVQVAGRAGRGDLPGRVIVQTYTPYHVAIQTALRLDYEAFYQDAMKSRRELVLPPIGHLAMIQCRGEVEEQVQQTAEAFAKVLEPALPPGTQLVPATPSPIARIKGYYHWQILVHGPHSLALSRVLREQLYRFRSPASVKVAIDMDAQSVM